MSRAFVLVLLLILPIPSLLDAGPGDPATADKIEEDWELVVASPDPDVTWTRLPLAPSDAPAGRLASRDRCLFAERCPFVMNVCWMTRPNATRRAEQLASCHLIGADLARPRQVEAVRATSDAV